MSKPTWGDLHNATFQDIKRVYKLNDRQLEQQVRKHLDGASSVERRTMYHTVWDSKNKK